MAVTYTAGTSTESTGSVTSTTVTLPSGLAAGDYTIIVVSLNATSGVITTPSGWTNILASTNSVNGSTSDALAIFYRKWVSGDTNPAVTTTNGRVAATPIKVSGADGTTFIDTAATVTQAASGATTIAAPTITPTSVNLVCVWNGRNATNGNFLTPWGSLTAGMTKTAEASGKATTATNAGHCFGTATVTAGAATGVKNANPAVATTGAMGVSFAIKDGATTGDVSAVTATATAAAVVPTVSAAATVAAPLMTATAAAIAPSVGVANTVAAPTATATATARVPGVTAAATVAAVRAQATAAALAPSVSAGGAVAAPVATATATAIAPAVSAGGTGSVSAVRMQATAAAVVPAVQAAATVAAALALATAAAVAPAVSAGATVQAPVATATATAIAPTVSTAANGQVNAVPATATATALAPVLHVSSNVQVPPATATAAALAPTVTALRQANVQAPVMGATVIAFAPGITAGVNITAVPATATATMLPPAVSGVNQVVAPRMQATATALPPGVTAAAVVAPTRMQATALALPPTVGALVLIQAPVATATAQLRAPSISAGLVTYVPPMTASARAYAPQVRAIDLRDIVLAPTPLPERFAHLALPVRYDVLGLVLHRYEITDEPLVARYDTIALPDQRFAAGLYPGGTMTTEILVSAGAQRFVGGTVTDVLGNDISSATFEMSLGSATYPGSTWVAPDISASGGSVSSRILKLKVTSTAPSGITVPGNYYVWARITSLSEVEPVRLQGPIVVR